MKKVFLLNLFLILFLQFAYAEAGSNIVFVDMQKALQNSKAGAQAQKGYEDAVKKEQVSIDGMKQEYQAKKTTFEQQKAGLNKTAKAKRQKELTNLENKMKKAFQESQVNLRKKNSKIVSKLIKELRETVEELGTKESYSMIFEKGSGSLLYGDSSVDITSKVVKLFDKRTKGKKF